jgi:GTP-binding protein EngB required for normal cell division
MDIIERKAIDPEGSIGSLYDASIDSLEDLPRIPIDSIKNQSQLSKKCFIKRGDEIQSENLLQFVGFDDQLRLSLLSDIVPPRGIGSMITYPYLIDEYTRLFYYSSTTQQTSFIDPINNIQQLINQSRVTHIITQIHSGIEIIVIIRLTNDHTDLIDNILNHISQSLYQENKLTEQYSLDQILSTYVYSNIPSLTEQKTIIDVYQSIISVKDKYDTHRPLNYILHPIKQFYPKHQSIFIPIEYNISHKIEEHLLRLTIPNKIWSTIIDTNTSDILNKYLKQQLNQQQQQLNTFTKQYQHENKRFQHFIINIRQGKYSKENQFKEILSDKIETTLIDNIDHFNYYLNNFKTKAQFITELNKRGFNYSNANEYNIQQGDDQINIQKKIIQDNKQRFICSNDFLNQNNWSTLNQLLTQMDNEKLRNKDLNLIYLDFSYSTFELDHIKRFPSNANIEQNKPLISTNQQSTYLSFQTLPKDKTINILLLGKSRVGKSTLINTFANYIKSKQNGSIIEIIISFMSLIDNEFERHFVRIGQYDSNEDYLNPEQSITQKCKSYIFQLTDGQKIRFIDTPGFCDQHQQRQDQLNMQRILSRLNHLTHLNAICILIDSNDNNINSLNIYLKELFNYLGNDAIQNTLFCFTKTLQNPINFQERNHQLELMIKSIPINNISINQENTFHFDSTFFIQSARERYLTPVGNYQNEIIKESLQITNNGWKRLLNHLQTNLQPYLIHQGLQYLEYLRLEIKQIIRPILETITNIIRNRILWKTESSSFSIHLQPKPISHHFSTCDSCVKTFYQCGHFWIIYDSLHQYYDKCLTCSCHLDQHKPIDYRLEYIYSDNPSNYRSNQMSNYLEKLIDGIIYFGHFLKDTTHISDNDQILSYLNRIIQQETLIIQNKSPNIFNWKLRNQLVKLKYDYQYRISRMRQTDHHHDIIFIDKLIDSIQQIPFVRDQINVNNQIQEINV